MLTPLEAAAVAVRALDSKKGKDIALLKISDLTVMADHFIICTGTSNTHIKSLCDEAEKALEEAGEELSHIEGHRSGTWVLMDFGTLVIHVFTEETRKFYDLERLWADAETVDISQYVTE